MEKSFKQNDKSVRIPLSQRILTSPNSIEIRIYEWTYQGKTNFRSEANFRLAQTNPCLAQTNSGLEQVKVFAKFRQEPAGEFCNLFALISQYFECSKSWPFQQNSQS